MITPKRLAVALAVFSVSTTTLAAPASPFDAAPSLALRDATEPPPTACTVQEKGESDNYGITVPIAHTHDKCIEAHSAISEYTASFNDAWLCEPYGDWTILIFTAKKEAADNIDEAFRRVFPGFTFQCANTTAVKVNSLFARHIPGTCILLEKDPLDLYQVHMPVEIGVNRCDESKNQLAPYIDEASWTCTVFGIDHNLMLSAPKGSAGHINEELVELYPIWDLLCGDPSKAVLEKDVGVDGPIATHSQDCKAVNCPDT
ncbi:hypothetical protein M409DRAFT_26990 [Zasmidium cellare ATCC 36951]|uniref:Uncharacterized protein n=1 Tax=Zasmidium cellare ATCC 36951 TaxID=1080233 RepID=A0A6A6CA26_ZASCE|nr:uncharacterized protein M409DRAFT_26990 [Zasmidium cellare ATCC 36951]KAF2162752.1 hypothetical protein M409DRAFT_26990 [Zasmidium cellare ATCC 36951]